MDRSNKVFQKSYEHTTCQLYTEMIRLVKLYAANILTTDSIEAAGDNLKNLKFDNIVDKEHMGIGSDTWFAVSAMEQEHDTKPFFDAVKKFYVISIKKMIQKFPFGDSLLRDLEILKPKKLTSSTIDSVIGLAKRFPQLELSDAPSLDKLREECLDYILSPSDLPTVEEYTGADQVKRHRVGRYWWEVGVILTLAGECRFPSLTKLMMGLLSIPASNADSERGFSILRKIHTDQRSQLSQSTIVAVMSIKFNCDDCCFRLRIK